MVGLVVQHEDVLVVHQLGQHALDHLSFGLESLQLGAVPLQQSAAALRELESLAQFERVIVRNDDLRALKVDQQIRRDQFASGV